MMTRHPRSKEPRTTRTTRTRTWRTWCLPKRVRVVRIVRGIAPRFALALGIFGWLATGCGPGPDAIKSTAPDPHLATNGAVEVTARLVEIPEGAIFKRDLYDYATILKYQVLQVHRGPVDGDALYVGHYNPWKPRAEAADKRAPGIGGNVRQFRAGQTHRLALEVPIEEHFMGGIVNKYFGQTTNVLYWAVWTNLE